MDIIQPEYISLEHLATTLRLPKSYLRGLAKVGTIPVLHVGSRMRFRVEDVRHALRELTVGQRNTRDRQGVLVGQEAACG